VLLIAGAVFQQVADAWRIAEHSGNHAFTTEPELVTQAILGLTNGH